LDNDVSEPDGFEEAMQAGAKLSEAEIKRLSEEGDDDFRKVSHDECVYRAGVLLLESAVNSPRDILAVINDDRSITEIEKRYLKSFEERIIKESATLSKLAKSALVVARRLEGEHLARIGRVSRTLSKKDSAVAVLCYPVTRWNLEKYCWRLLYHMGIDDMADLSQLVSRLSYEYSWVKQAYERVVMIPLLGCAHDRNDAWDLAASTALGVPLPSSGQERKQLMQKYGQRRQILAASLAEVHFGRYGRFTGLPRHEVGDIAEELEKAGHESLLDALDQYSKELKETPLFELLPVEARSLVKGLMKKSEQIVREKSIFRPGGYRPRNPVIEEIGHDPYLALLADIIDEAKGTKATMKRLADENGIPIGDIYNFQRRRKYKKHDG
jgi:hypothetical protein